MPEADRDQAQSSAVSRLIAVQKADCIAARGGPGSSIVQRVSQASGVVRQPVRGKAAEGHRTRRQVYYGNEGLSSGFEL